MCLRDLPSIQGLGQNLRRMSTHMILEQMNPEEIALFIADRTFLNVNSSSLESLCRLSKAILLSFNFVSYADRSYVTSRILWFLRFLMDLTL